MKTLETEEEAEIEQEEVVDQVASQEEETETPEETTETVDDAEKTSEEPTGEEEDDSGELVISIEGVTPTPEEEKEEAPEWVKNTRKANRTLNKKVETQEKEIEELKAKLNPDTGKLRPEPTLESSGDNEAQFQSDMKAYLIEEREQEDKQKDIEDSQKQELDSWKAKETAYFEGKTSIKNRIPNYDDAVEEAEGVLSDMQKAAILGYFEKPEILIYALGKSPELENLAKITDPMKFGLAVQKLESKMKVGKRKPQTPPEEIVVGSTQIKGADAYLEKLEKSKKAQGGDRTEINAYKRELREKAQAARGD